MSAIEVSRESYAEITRLLAISQELQELSKGNGLTLAGKLEMKRRAAEYRDKAMAIC